MVDERPRVLIEDWLPITELGIESRRESAPIPGQFPKLKTLHVWWARRPLVASAAVVLAGILPAWTPELAVRYADAPELQSEKAYRRWLLYLVGVWGDPVAARRAIDAANLSGVKLPGNGYGYKQAFKNSPPPEARELVYRLLVDTWGALPVVADPTAGGGSIPFVSVRMGLPTLANDLNPVAASVLKVGVEYPSKHGSSLVPPLKKWGKVLTERVEERLRPYFPREAGEQIIAYIWVNAVRCPNTGGLIPLMGDKWLREGKGANFAVEITFNEDGEQLPTPRIQVVSGQDVDEADAAKGFVSRGSAWSPYDHLAVSGDYIKREAQAGRLTRLLYAVAVRNVAGTRAFRAPTKKDLDAVAAAETRFEEIRDSWEREGFLPNGRIPEGLKTSEPLRYGLTSWLDMFTPRQALVHGTFSEVFHELIPLVREDLGQELGDAVLCELAVMQAKAINWNSRLSSWDISRQKLRSVFDSHNFAFKWTFAEFEGAQALGAWSFTQLLDAYEGIVALLHSDGIGHYLPTPEDGSPIDVTQGSAADLAAVPDGAVTHICMDPPYYDNVMYSELSDYFYVWEKNTLGRLLPDFFTDDLTDKDNEAVANVARFANTGKRKKELATLDYQAKMTAIFAEARRILRDDGVMTVMFTHKRADAWDTLGASLLDAGFTIETSWPVNTESVQSLHQANMNSAASTIMLVCRKRTVPTSHAKVFLDDLAGDIRTAARDAATTFRAQGIDGVDLLLSAYGPVLSVISQNWPVYTMAADATGASQLVRPEQALDIAREEIIRLQRARIVGHNTQIDNHTDFVLMAWETFKAAEFPYDDARRLALATGGLDVKELEVAKVVTAGKGKVRLLAPAERVRRLSADDSTTGVRIDADRFEYMNDAVDTVLHIAAEDGFTQAKTFMDRLRLLTDDRFTATVQGLVNAIPRTKAKGDWVIPQAGLLDTLVTAYLPDITLPPAPAVDVTQMTLSYDSEQS